MTSTEARGRVAPSKAEIDEARALAREVGLEYVDLDRYPLNAAAASLLPEQMARRHHALAVGWKYGTPVVAVATPDNVLAMDDVRTVIGRDIHAVVACASQIDAYIERMYSHGGAPVSARAVTPSAPPEAAPPAAHRAKGRKEEEKEKAAAPPPPPPAAPKAPPAPTAPVVTEESVAPAEPEPVLEATAAEAAEATALTEEPPGEADVEKVDDVALAAAAEAGDEELAGPEQKAPALADVLVESGQVTPEEMEAALREHAATGRPLGEILAELGLVSDEDLIRAMAAEVGLEYVDLNEWPLDPSAASLLPEAMARRHQALAIGYRDGAPVVALANPSNVFALDDLRTLLGREFTTVVSSPRQVAEYISRMYRRDEETEAAARSAVSQSGSDQVQVAELTDLHAVVEDAPIVKYVNLILRQALQERASDVHIEPTADDLRIRFRIDGVMHDITRSPKAIHGGVTTRLKVMADLDIAEHRIPQDGRISLSAGKRQVDLRVATLPTVHGEKVVMRVLDKSNAMLDLSELGFLPDVQKRYEAAFRKPYGTILVTGPTGSGKSTTLYATLNALNSPERNLITVEDPVEYQLPGVNQVQVNPKAGLTFASTLRSILRSDPDIILVGEVRDRETAIIAIEAALTGHLVLSSLHTNDAAGTPMRLVEMGVEPFLVGSSLDCVVAQRLARQLCENCNEAYNPTTEELAAFGWTEEDAPAQGQVRFRKAVGCQACSRTGYRGRIAVHELLLITEEVERLIIAGASVDELNRLGLEQGMVSLRRDGLRKAALGLTSLEEVLRVVA
ncbi:MAG TPA: ATPase, T2SS/T4P/T4SS family [Acidimicrobiales bacterium]|nr:ATPase, T2SS/T4P/T4SS family [Acidimicrobiales bacterium]